VQYERRRRFPEQSLMLSRKLWRHERIVAPAPAPDGAVLVRVFVKWFFERRHAVLRRRFGEG
jgi:hypothetical protein